MMGMFTKIEKEARQELIKLYEDFIKNPKSEKVKDRAEELEWKYGNAGKVLSKEVSLASWRASHISLGDLKIKEAKDILEKLKIS